MSKNLTVAQKQIDLLANRLGGKTHWINVDDDPFKLPKNGDTDHNVKRLFFLALKSVDATSVSILDDSSEVDSIQALRISNTDLRKDHLWLDRLKELRFIRFEDCSVSAKNISCLGCASDLQYLVFLGGKIDDEQLSAIQGLGQISCIVFAGVEIQPAQVEELRRHMSSFIVATDLDRASSDNCTPIENLGPVEVTYQASLGQLGRIQNSLDRIHGTLRDSGLSNRHQFLPPATELQIDKLQLDIGIRIPDDVRLLLERHNGQLESEQLVCLAPFSGTDSIRNRFLFRYGYCLDDFHWFNYCDANLNWPWLGIPIMGIDALTIFANPLNGQVFVIDGISGYVLTNTLADFMERLADEVAKQAEAEVEEVNIYSVELCDPKCKVRINPVQ